MLNMLAQLKKFFSSNENDSSYVDHTIENLDDYRKRFQDLEISEVKIPSLEYEKYFVIKKWFKKDGDRIVKNERLCILETESLSIELESAVNGYIYFRQKPKQSLKTDQIVCVIIQKRID